MIETTESAPASQATTPESAREVGRVQWWLDTIKAMAPELRAAGISSVMVGDFRATFLPAPTPQPTFEDVKNDEPDVPDGIDALNDPRSYPGGVVPGFKIEKFEIEE